MLWFIRDYGVVLDEFNWFADPMYAWFPEYYLNMIELKLATNQNMAPSHAKADIGQ